MTINLPQLIFLPGLIAFFIAFAYSSKKALFNVYLITMLLIPAAYHYKLPFFPVLTFSTATALALFIPFIVLELHQWKTSIADFLVLGYVAWGAVAEFRNTDIAITRNVLFQDVVSILIPYMLAKGLIRSHADNVSFAKRAAFIIFLQVVLIGYTAIDDLTIFDRVLDRFFPGQWHGHRELLRFGNFVRVSGGYTHPILAGTFFFIGYRLSRLVEWNKLWEKRFKYLPALPLAKATIIRLTLVWGIYLSFSRGPMLGFVAAAFVCAIGLARNRWSSFINRLILGLFIASFGWVLFKGYAITTNPQSETQYTAVYRWELIQEYTPIIMEQPIFGWGDYSIPHAEGEVGGNLERSVDNFFLLLALKRGLVGLAIIVIIFVTFFIRLIKKGLMSRSPALRGSDPIFTYLGILFGLFVTITTVWMDPQLTQFIFFLMGAAESAILCKQRSSSSATTQATPSSQLSTQQPVTA